LRKTDLNSRILWFDGDSTVSSTDVEDFLGTGTEGLFVDKLTAEIKKYNRFVSKKEQLDVKHHVNELDFTWNIPREYANINVIDYVIGRMVDEADKTQLNENELDSRLQRVATELKLYESLGLLDILKVLIYIINTLERNSVVWGVGRGSSVSSYVLFLIGVHDVDSYEYELDINDFLR